jgi:CRP/FNR family transcriptional regulator
MYNPRMPVSLADLPLLSQLTEEQRSTVINAGYERSLERGEILFHENDPAEALYALISGQLKLVRYSPKGRELLLHLVNPGQTFAEAALFAPGTYPATAEVMQTCRLWCLPRAALLDLLGASPDLGVAMLGSISLWTRKLASKLELHTQRRVEERVAIYLLSRAGPRDLQPGDKIELAEPRNLIAAQCGTAPEVLSRTFRRLEEDGVLEAAPHHVTITDPEKLRALAEWIE